MQKYRCSYTPAPHLWGADFHIPQIHPRSAWAAMIGVPAGLTIFPESCERSSSTVTPKYIATFRTFSTDGEDTPHLLMVALPSPTSFSSLETGILRSAQRDKIFWRSNPSPPYNPPIADIFSVLYKYTGCPQI